MQRRIWSIILTVCLLLALTPNTAMAATMERTPNVILETSAPEAQDAQEAPAKQPETTKKQAAAPAAVPSDLEGSGTETNPYRIKDATQLRKFADAVNGIGGVPNTGICAVLTQNINLSGVCSADTGSWTPIGTNTHPYRGTFDGASFAVSGLYCQKPGGSYAGLFGANAGIIKNLGVSGGSVSAGSYAGGLCGINKGTITGCYSAASVSGDKYTGGVCGYNDNGATINVCYNIGAINGGKYVGGICGYNKNTTSDCYNTGTVIGNSTSIGGICGYNKKLVSGCFNTGEVGGGTNYVGSVCGYNHSGSTFVNCYYLITGTEKGNYGIGMTQQQFSSGEVCYALNEGNGGSVVWKQTCGTGLPDFGGKAVYRTQSNKSDGSTVFAYTNDSNKKTVAYTAPAPYTAPTYASSGENTGNNSGGHTHVYQEPKWDWKKYESAKAVLTCQDCGEEFVLKASIKKEVTQPTCTEDGETVYKASVEKDGITFKEEKVVEKERTGHSKELEEIFEQTTETCEKPIYTKHCFMCPACKTYFEDKDGKKVLTKAQVGYKAPLKHTYQGPDWSWPTQNIATAVFSCQNCPKKTPVAATVKRTEITLAPTCETPGTCVYTATVTFQKTPYTDKKTDGVIPAKGHSLKLDPNGPDGPQYKCTRTGCTHTESLNSKPGTTTGNTDKEDAPKPDSDIKDETLTPDETISGNEGPTLPPDPEETPEAPAPSEDPNETGTPDMPNGSDGTDIPETPDVPDNSGGQNTPEVPDDTGNANTPEIPDGSDDSNTGTPNVPDGSNDSGTGTPNVPDGSDDSGTGTPNVPDGSDDSGTGTPNVPGGSDDSGTGTPNVPDESGNSDGLDVPNASDIPDMENETEAMDNTTDLQANASRDGLLYPEGETDKINENAISLRAVAARNAAIQPDTQQNMPLWGAALALMLLAGIISLVILQRKHKESE